MLPGLTDHRFSALYFEQTRLRIWIFIIDCLVAISSCMYCFAFLYLYFLICKVEIVRVFKAAGY